MGKDRCEDYKPRKKKPPDKQNDKSGHIKRPLFSASVYDEIEFDERLNHSMASISAAMPKKTNSNVPKPTTADGKTRKRTYVTPKPLLTNSGGLMKGTPFVYRPEDH